jgi:hypothetical protein
MRRFGGVVGKTTTAAMARRWRGDGAAMARRWHSDGAAMVRRWLGGRTEPAQG